MSSMQLSTVCLSMTGAELKNLRYKAGFTNVATAAAMMCVPTSTWHSWEAGRINIEHPGMLYRALIGFKLEQELAAREKERQNSD